MPSLSSLRECKRFARGRDLFVPGPGWVSNEHWMVRYNGQAKGLPPRAGLDWRAWCEKYLSGKRVPLRRLGEGLDDEYCGADAEDWIAWYTDSTGRLSAVGLDYDPLLNGLDVVRIDSATIGDLFGGDVESNHPIAGLGPDGEIEVVLAPRRPW